MELPLTELVMTNQVKVLQLMTMGDFVAASISTAHTQLRSSKEPGLTISDQQLQENNAKSLAEV